MLRERSEFRPKYAFRFAGAACRRWWLAAIAGVGLLLGAPARLALAESTSEFYVRLHYSVERAATDCWDEREFRGRVARAVGYDPFRSDAAMLVDVRVGGAGGLVDGRVEWQSESGSGMGERRFIAKDGDCARLLTEMSFAVGLQIDLLRPKPADGTPSNASAASPGSSSAAAPATPPPAPTTASSASPTASTNDASSRAAPTRWQSWIGAGPALAWGLSPSLTGQGRVFFGAQRGVPSFELGLTATLPSAERNPDGSGFRQYLLGGSAAVCGHQRLLAGCVLGGVSALRARGLGVDQPRSPGALVAQLGARVVATWEPSARWLLRPHLDALALLTPRAVSVNGVELWKMPPVSLVAGIDVAVRFP